MPGITYEQDAARGACRIGKTRCHADGVREVRLRDHEDSHEPGPDANRTEEIRTFSEEEGGAGYNQQGAR